MKNDSKSRAARFAANEAMIRFAYVTAKARREGKDYTRDQIAKECGLERHTLARWGKIKEFPEWFEEQVSVFMRPDDEWVENQARRLIIETGNVELLKLEGIRCGRYTSAHLKLLEGFQFNVGKK